MVVEDIKKGGGRGEEGRLREVQSSQPAAAAASSTVLPKNESNPNNNLEFD